MAKQRKDEVLLDVEAVALEYETKLRWNDPGSWVWLGTIAQKPLATVEQFEAAQLIRSDGGRSRQAVHEASRRVRHPYALRGLL